MHHSVHECMCLSLWVHNAAANACVCVGVHNSCNSILCKCTLWEWVFKSTLVFFCVGMCLLINGKSLVTAFITTLFIVHFLSHVRWHRLCACRTEDVSPVGDRLLSTEEQVTLITESMTVTSNDQEKLLLLNKNTELRRVNKEVKWINFWWGHKSVYSTLKLKETCVKTAVKQWKKNKSCIFTKVH